MNKGIWWIGWWWISHSHTNITPKKISIKTQTKKPIQPVAIETICSPDGDKEGKLQPRSEGKRDWHQNTCAHTWSVHIQHPNHIPSNIWTLSLTVRPPVCVWATGQIYSSVLWLSGGRPCTMTLTHMMFCVCVIVTVGISSIHKKWTFQELDISWKFLLHSNVMETNAEDPLSKGN